jgi:hypothetical protein
MPRWAGLHNAPQCRAMPRWAELHYVVCCCGGGVALCRPLLWKAGLHYAGRCCAMSRYAAFG